MTKRRIADLVFIAFLGVVVLFVYMEAQGWPRGARLFPVGVAVGMGGLLLAQAVAIVLKARQEGSEARDEPLWPGMDPALAWRRALTTAATFVVMAVGVWLLGFPIGGPLVLAGHLLLVMRERLVVSVLLVAGSVGALWALSELLNIPFPDPVLPFVSNPF